MDVTEMMSFEEYKERIKNHGVTITEELEQKIQTNYKAGWLPHETMESLRLY